MAPLHRRYGALVVLAGAAAVVLLSRALGGRPVPPGGGPREMAATPPEAVAEATPDPQPDAVTLSLGLATGRRRAEIAPGGLGRAAAEDYRRRARFPRWSQPLEDGEDPIVRDRQVTPVVSRGPNGADPALVVFPSNAGFESPDPAVLHAYLAIGERRIPAREIRGTLVTEEGVPAGEVVYQDDGTAGDAVPGDGLYTAVFAPGPDGAGALARSYLVKVHALTTASEERLAATSFLYSAPHGQLTGAYRDAVVTGGLNVDAEIDVTAVGRFHLEATLYSADGKRALAWAQTAAELTPGRHWLTLPFYGLALREQGADGPYLVRWVALSTTSDMPNAKNRLVENAHVTAAYRASAFTDRPFDDPEMLDAARRVEQDQATMGALEAGG